MCLRIADATVAVSAGVATSLRAFTARPVEVVTNGCDYGMYAGADPDPALRTAAAGSERIAAFAGNINGRIDFSLLRRAAVAEPGTLFAMLVR